eukprot:2768718-Pyramimonas_sp.AAC.1
MLQQQNRQLQVQIECGRRDHSGEQQELEHQRQQLASREMEVQRFGQEEMAKITTIMQQLQRRAEEVDEQRQTFIEMDKAKHQKDTEDMEQWKRSQLAR